MARTVRRDHRTGFETRDNPNGCRPGCGCYAKQHKAYGNGWERNRASVRRKLQ